MISRIRKILKSITETCNESKRTIKNWIDKLESEKKKKNMNRRRRDEHLQLYETLHKCTYDNKKK